MKELCFAISLSLLTVGAESARAAKIRIVSFSSILAEIAEAVGGEHVTVDAVVKPGVDPHEYEPTPSDLRAVSEARLILLSGRHLENYWTKLQEATGGQSNLLPVGDRLKPLAAEDPHWWQSVREVEQATRIVRDELIACDPATAADYQKNADAYLAKLEELRAWIAREVAALPRDRRKLVTSHDAFQYFARDYGFTISAIEGLTTESEPSNRHVAELIDQIKKEKVKAIFVESSLNPKVVKEITRETGAKVGGVLYADGLGPGDASTYQGMMKHNVSTIVNALK